MSVLMIVGTLTSYFFPFLAVLLHYVFKVMMMMIYFNFSQYNQMERRKNGWHIISEKYQRFFPISTVLSDTCGCSCFISSVICLFSFLPLSYEIVYYIFRFLPYQDLRGLSTFCLFLPFLFLVKVQYIFENIRSIVSEA